MPTELMRSLADEADVEVETVEEYWKECKESVKNHRQNWGKVTQCVKNKLGLEE